VCRRTTINCYEWLFVVSTNKIMMKKVIMTRRNVCCLLSGNTLAYLSKEEQNACNSSLL